MNNFFTFQSLIEPFQEDDFFTNYYDQKYLHIKAVDRDKFSKTFSWDAFADILNMTSIWTSSSLQLVLDKTKLDAEKYCYPEIDREKNEVFQPNPKKVREYLNKGATMIANDVDSLNPNVASIANLLEEKFSSKTQCNIYFSKEGRQGFDVHFDVHEVFAINIIGEKVWNIYDGRVDNPINSEAYISLDKDYAKTNCGNIIDQVLMKPGDILYIPRGQFHEALASSDRSMHLSYSVTHIIGHDILSLLFNEAMEDSFFRSNFPMSTLGTKEMTKWLNSFDTNLSKLIKSKNFFQLIQSQIKNYKFVRGDFKFPDDINIEPKQRFSFKQNVTVKNVGAETILELNKKGIKIPNKYIEIVKTMISLDSFTIEELHKSYNKLNKNDLLKLIEDLSNMNLIK